MVRITKRAHFWLVVGVIVACLGFWAAMRLGRMQVASGNADLDVERMNLLRAMYQVALDPTISSPGPERELCRLRQGYYSTLELEQEIAAVDDQVLRELGIDRRKVADLKGGYARKYAAAARDWPGQRHGRCETFYRGSTIVLQLPAKPEDLDFRPK